MSAVVSRSLERKTFRLEQKIEIHQNYYKNHKNAQKIIIINQKHKLTKKIISGKYQVRIMKDFFKIFCAKNQLREFGAIFISTFFVLDASFLLKNILPEVFLKVEIYLSVSFNNQSMSG